MSTEKLNGKDAAECWVEESGTISRDRYDRLKTSTEKFKVKDVVRCFNEFWYIEAVSDIENVATYCLTGAKKKPGIGWAGDAVARQRRVAINRKNDNVIYDMEKIGVIATLIDASILFSPGDVVIESDLLWVVVSVTAIPFSVTELSYLLMEVGLGNGTKVCAQSLTHRPEMTKICTICELLATSGGIADGFFRSSKSDPAEWKFSSPDQIKALESIGKLIKPND